MRAELADGRVLEFPDGTDPSVIQATVKKVISSTPLGDKAGPQDIPQGIANPPPQAQPSTPRDVYGGSLSDQFANTIGDVRDKISDRMAGAQEAHAKMHPSEQGPGTFMSRTRDKILGAAGSAADALAIPSITGISITGELAEGIGATGRAGSIAKNIAGEASRDVKAAVGRGVGRVTGETAKTEAAKVGMGVRQAVTDDLGQLDKEIKVIESGKTASSVGAVKSASDLVDAGVKAKQKAKLLADNYEADHKAALDSISSRPAAEIPTIQNEREMTAIVANKDPAFVESRTRAAAGDFPQTNPDSAPLMNGLRKAVDEAMANSVKSSRRTLSIVKDDLGALTPEEGEMATLDHLEELRRKLKEPSTNDPEGYKALPSKVQQHLSDKIRSVMEAYDPRVGTYIDTYAKKSREIEAVQLREKLSSMNAEAAEKYLKENYADLARDGFNKKVESVVAAKRASEYAGKLSERASQYVEKKAKEAAKAASSTGKKAGQQAAQLEKNKAALDTYVTNLDNRNIPVDQQLKNARKLVEDIYANGQGRMTKEEYVKFHQQIDQAQATAAEHKEAISRLRSIAYGLSIFGLGGAATYYLGFGERSH